MIEVGDVKRAASAALQTARTVGEALRRSPGLALLTAVAAAVNAETQIRVGEGWWEKPILWTMLVGDPSTMKSPIIDKVTRPLRNVDKLRAQAWKQQYSSWKQSTAKSKPLAPPRPARCLINDATAEKIAEILSRHPSGSLMLHDELAGWMDGFDRYTSGASSRAFFLQCWSGGPHNKDRVGKGVKDEDAEIFIENLALCILGGIQPDRLAEIGGLTEDGLLQRFIPVLMSAAKRGDEDRPVSSADADYKKLLQSVNDAPVRQYHLADDALEIRNQINDHLYKLQSVDGFSRALLGAIGKLRGYFARICLVLQVAREHDPLWKNVVLPPSFTPERREALAKLFAFDPTTDSLSAGLNKSAAISRVTAEAADRLVRDFLLPHIFVLYDVVVNGGKDRHMLRSIGDFILASKKERVRPSDVTAGVRALRGQPEQKIREWMGRFCAMGWLRPEEGRPGIPPKAWNVEPGLREHFADRRQQAQSARAEAHKILLAGGSRPQRAPRSDGSA